MKKTLFLVLAMLALLVIGGIFVFAVPQIPTVYKGQITAIDNQSVNNVEIEMVSGNFNMYDLTNETGNYEIRFETDDSETSISEGVKSGDEVAVYANGNFIETFYVTDFGINTKDFSNVDTAHKILPEENTQTLPKKGSSTIIYDNTSKEEQESSGDETPSSESDKNSEDISKSSDKSAAENNIENTDLLNAQTNNEEKNVEKISDRPNMILVAIIIAVIIVVIIIILLVMNLKSVKNK